jgi:hypothetical protein
VSGRMSSLDTQSNLHIPLLQSEFSLARLGAMASSNNRDMEGQSRSDVDNVHSIAPVGLGQNSDTGSGDGLDQAGRELNRLARISLVVSQIEQHRAELPELLNLAATDPARQAAALIELVEDGCTRLRQLDDRYGEVATELFGADTGEHGRPYASRLAAAADAWEPGLQPASFNRRHRNKVVRELMRTVKNLRSDANAPAFRLWLERDPAFQPLRDEDDWPNLSFKRLHVRARSRMQGIDRRPSHTDWTYHDVVTNPTDGFYRVPTKDDNARVEIQAISPNVRAVRPLGVSRHGFQVWLMRFTERLAVGDDFEWSIRKVFHRFDDTEAEPGWLALGVSQPGPIESGTFELVFRDAEKPPVEFVRFVTPKQTLPNLRGTEWPVEPNRSVATASFQSLEPNYSYGLMWSWRVGGIAQRHK